MANSIKQTGNIRTGRGIALGSFGGSQAGAVVEITVDMKSGKITVKKAYSAQVAGLTVFLDGAVNQMEGNLVQGSSRALWEGVTFNTKRQTSLDWTTYPILRFKDSPLVYTKIVPADGPGSDRIGRAAHLPGAGLDRERVLRCNRRSHPRGADDTCTRPCDPRGRRSRLASPEPGGASPPLPAPLCSHGEGEALVSRSFRC